MNDPIFINVYADYIVVHDSEAEAIDEESGGDLLIARYMVIDGDVDIRRGPPVGLAAMINDFKGEKS